MDNSNINKLAYGFQSKDCGYNYRIGRPSYPIESVNYLKRLGLTNDSVIVDLGGGTGKYTEVMVKEGFNNVTIVEPSIEFCNEANSLLVEIKKDVPLLNYKILNETSTSISLPSNSIDCVISAHSFHWFSNIDSIKEISRILKPNGILAIIWNKPDSNLNSKDLLKDIIQLYKNPYYNESSIPGRKSPTAILLENWDNVFKEIKLNSNLHYLINTDLIYSGGIENHEITNGDRVIAYSLSQSYMSLLPIDKKEKFVNDLKLNLQNNPTTSNGKSFTVIYKTEIYHTRKPTTTQ